MTNRPADEERPTPPEYGAARNGSAGGPAPEAVREAFKGAETLLRGVSSAVYSQMRVRAAAEESARDAVLASDAEREAATVILSDAFAAGRLTADELEQRTTRVLAARAPGELDEVLVGLGGYQAAVKRHPVRKVLFGVVALITSPFTLVGVLALLAGADLGDRIFGVVLLAVLLPALYAHWRWAWPKRQ